MLTGLFVDDGTLAIAIIVIFLLSWTFAVVRPDMPFITGTLLVAGCLGVLFANVMIAARRYK
jgi:hypothetical protein